MTDAQCKTFSESMSLVDFKRLATSMWDEDLYLSFTRAIYGHLAKLRNEGRLPLIEINPHIGFQWPKLWNQFVSGKTDYSWELMDPIAESLRPRVKAAGDHPAKTCEFIHTISGMIEDGRFDGPMRLELRASGGSVYAFCEPGWRLSVWKGEVTKAREEWSRLIAESPHEHSNDEDAQPQAMLPGQ